MARPVDTRALKNMAIDASAAGDTRRALQLYRDLAAAEPDDARWLMKIGETHRSLGENAEALAAFRTASDSYARAGLDLKAVAACRVVLQMAPDDTETLERLRTLMPRASAPSNPSLAAIPRRPREQPARGASGSPTGTARAESDDAPDVSLGDEERVTLEQVDLAAILPSKKASGAPAGTREVEIDRRVAPVDTGYLDLSFDEFEPTPPKPTALRAPPAAATAAPVPAPSAASASGINALTEAPDDPFAAGSTETPETANPAPAVVAEQLRGLPLIGRLPAEALEGFVRRIEVLNVAPGDRVIAEGDVADKIYVVVRGDLVATRGTPPRPLARLGEGAFFGEMALLDETPRSASVVAVTDAELLVLPRRVVLQLSEEYPSVLATLMQSLRSRLIATLTATSPLFARIPASERPSIVGRFRLREIEAGTVMIREGQKTDSLYVLLTGRADVTLEGHPIATLTTGDVCGEMSLLSGGVAEATVQARTRVTSLALPAGDLQQIIMVHPQVLEHLATLSESRRSELEIRRSGQNVETRSVRRV